MVDEQFGDDYVSKSECLFHSKKHITYLFKNFLTLLEDIKFDHDANYAKFSAIVGEDKKEALEVADFLDQQKFQYYRKKILDLGNGSIRNLEKDFDVV